MHLILAKAARSVAAALLFAATAASATEPAAPAKPAADPGKPAAASAKPAAAATPDDSSVFYKMFKDFPGLGLNLFGNSTKSILSTGARPDPGDPVSVRSDPGDPVAPKPTPKPGTTPK
jgi:hypothetical protein